MSRKGNPVIEYFDRKCLKIVDREFSSLCHDNREAKKILKKRKGITVYNITSSPVVVFEKNVTRCPLGTTTKRNPGPNPPQAIHPELSCLSLDTQ